VDVGGIVESKLGGEQFSLWKDLDSLSDLKKISDALKMYDDAVQRLRNERELKFVQEKSLQETKMDRTVGFFLTIRADDQY
jgi:hypothetical protein